MLENFVLECDWVPSGCSVRHVESNVCWLEWHRCGKWSS